MLIPFHNTRTELEGVFVGRIEQLTTTGDAVVSGFTGPRIVVVPVRLLNGHRPGDEIRYRCAIAETRDFAGRRVVGDWAVVTRIDR